MPEIEAFKSYIDQHCLDTKIVDVSVEILRILQGIYLNVPLLRTNYITHLSQK